MNAAQDGSLTRLWSRARPSQALLVALSVGGLLMLAFLWTWAAYRTQPQRVAWSDYMQWPQFLALSLLGLIICAMSYWLVRLWHEDLPVEDRSLESAWQAGLQVVHKRGQRLDQFPVFLVLNAGGAEQGQALIEQSGLHLLEPLAPADRMAPLHWALTEQGIWLFIRGAGVYTAVAERLALRQTTSAQTHFNQGMVTRYGDAFDTSTSVDTALAGVQVDEAVDVLNVSPETVRSDARPAVRSVQAEATNGEISAAGNDQTNHSTDANVSTLMLEAESANTPMPVSAGFTVGSTGTSAGKSAGTIVEASARLDQLEDLLRSGCQAESLAGGVDSDLNPPSGRLETSSWAKLQTRLAFEAASGGRVLSSIEATRRQLALQEVCRRLRSERGAVAAANGIVALIDSQQLMVGPVRASELGLALRSDVQLMQDQLQIQAPITLVVDGMEKAPGVSELVRRGGPEAAKTDVMGAAYPIRFQPEKRLVAHVCRLAMAQIELRIYRYLMANEGLRQVGNHQLFQLLTAGRSRLLPSLQIFAGEALGMEPEAEHPREPFLLAGVHLVASGSKVTQQAWTPAALSHVVGSQNFLRWTKDRLHTEQKLKLAISLVKAVCAILLVTFIAALCVAS